MNDDGAIRWKHWSILEVCESIKCSCTGVSDPLCDEELTDLLSWLNWRIEHWQAPREPQMYVEFDGAVLRLICATVIIAGVELERRRKP